MSNTAYTLITLKWNLPQKDLLRPAILFLLEKFCVFFRDRKCNSTIGEIQWIPFNTYSWGPSKLKVVYIKQIYGYNYDN